MLRQRIGFEINERPSTAALSKADCLLKRILRFVQNDSGLNAYFRSTVQYALSRKFFQLAYFGLPSLIVSIGLRFGRTGF